jgi:hypothetical protein
MGGVAAMMLWKVALDLGHKAYIMVGQPGSDLNFKQVCFEQLFPIALISKQPSCIQGQRSVGMGCRSKDFYQVKLARQDDCLCSCQFLDIGLTSVFGLCNQIPKRFVVHTTSRGCVSAMPDIRAVWQYGWEDTNRKKSHWLAVFAVLDQEYLAMASG